MSEGKVERFVAYGIHVGNLAESAEFYAKRLGCERIAEGQGVDERGLFGAHGARVDAQRFSLPGCDAYLELVDIRRDKARCDMRNANPGTSHVCWYVDDLGATWNRLEGDGVRIVSKSVVEVPDGPMKGGKAVYFRDTDDVRVELLEGDVYLDLSRRGTPHLSRPQYVTEFSHVGVHVTNLAESLWFYRDVLGLELFAEWFIPDQYVRDVVGYPDASLNMAVFRLPGTLAFLEVIEYQGVERKAIDPGFGTAGACKLAFEVGSLKAFKERIAGFALGGFSEGAHPAFGAERDVFFMRDPDGFLIQIGEA